MDILFLSRWFPHPADNGSKLRISQLLAGLAQSHRVTLVSFMDDLQASADLKPVPGLDQISEVHTLPWREFQSGSLRATLGLVHPVPRFLIDTHSSDMASLIRNTVGQHNYDVVVASQLSMASYYACFQCIPAIFEEIELGVFHDQPALKNGWERLRLNLTWFKINSYLSSLLHHFQAGTVVSEREHELFTQIFPGHRQKISVIPNYIDFEGYRDVHAEPRPNHLVFSGSFRYRANYDAMQWFIGKVYPMILERMPDTHLIITGDHENLPLPPSDNVIRAGYVEDIKSLIASCTVSLAPLWVGGGTRLKILEAMALGVPVVATSKGSEGLNARHGEHLLIADSPELFADKVLELLKNADRREELAGKARRFVENRFSWGANLPRFLRLVEDAAQKRYNPREVLL